MSRFHPKYLVSYFVGEGLSGLLRGLLALAQGVGGTPECVGQYNNVTNTTTYALLHTESPRFSVEVYFFCLLGMYILSGLAFQSLQHKSVVKNALVPNLDVNPSRTGALDRENVVCTTIRCELPNVTLPFVFSAATNILFVTYRKGRFTIIENKSTALPHPKAIESEGAEHSSIAYLLVVTSLTFGTLYGVLPSVQSFACLPYGNSVYHLTLTLSHIANPLVCFIMLIPTIPKPTKELVSWATGIGLLLSIYAVVAALMSPEPPLKGTALGQAILVSS
jgi:riboflavin transporter 2